jgi:hypothetical protein
MLLTVVILIALILLVGWDVLVDEDSSPSMPALLPITRYAAPTRTLAAIDPAPVVTLFASSLKKYHHI